MVRIRRAAPFAATTPKHEAASSVAVARQSRPWPTPLDVGMRRGGVRMYGELVMQSSFHIFSPLGSPHRTRFQNFGEKFAAIEFQ